MDSYRMVTEGENAVGGGIVGTLAEVQGEYMPGNGDPPMVADTGALIDG